MENYHIIADDQAFNIERSNAESLDTVEVSANQFHILSDETSFQATLRSVNLDEKQYTIELNGNTYQIKIEDEYDQLIHKMGMESGGSQKLGNINAPMPGLILDILVSPGQTIASGDQLLVLEAMKMENVLKATGEGVVKSIAVRKGNAVDKGQLLIEME